jgi:squalene-hopene/tetraprenyl-beta-curcumene cyclase
MSISRRQFLLGATLMLAGCRKPSTDDTGPTVVTGKPPDNGPAPGVHAGRGHIEPRELKFPEPLAKGAAFLTAKQSKDGAWRSDLEGTFKDGTALTPLVLNALLHAAPDSPGVPRAAAWLAAMAKPDGTIAPPEKHGFDYPVYTAALTVSALSHPRCPDHRKARDTWLRYLKERQLTDALGWRPEDREYGGWGYCHGVPRKPKAGELIPPLTESNLSATTYALAALTAAQVPADDPAFAKALVFVKRCQNWHDDVKDNHPTFDDGGFFFIYDDPVRNKAGVVKVGVTVIKDDQGRERYLSYGSMTADGLRCLAMCGLGNHHRAWEAQHWLIDRFKPDPAPHHYWLGDRLDRSGVFFYYAASMAQSPAGQWNVDGPEPKVWKEVLAEVLTAKQQADGSWVNVHEAFREHEPLVATALACLALAHCQGPLKVFLSD